jgi:hypothetical protein
MMSRTQHIAACMGLDEGTIRRLQARGYLLMLELAGAVESAGVPPRAAIG